MSSEEQIMAKAQMNQSWYDTHMKMKRRRSECASIQSDHDSQDTWDIAQMMEIFDASDLRERIFVVQQQLYAYHDLLDEMEKVKAQNEQLECQHSELVKERSAHKKKLKKDARSTVQSLENEIVELKLELAQSRDKEEVHHARMRDVLDEKEALKEEVKAIRERQYETATNKISCPSATQPLNNLVLRKTSLFQAMNGRYSVPSIQGIACQSASSEKALKSSFLSPFHRRGSVRDVCDSLTLSDGCVKAQLDNTPRREPEGNRLSAITA